jgi:hypothetical protein
MTNVMRRVVRGETADSWVLDLIEMTLLRFESGDFSNNQPVPVKSAPRAEKSKPHVISLEEFEALTHAEADEEPLLASELEGPWIETIEAHVVDQPTPAKRNKLWVPADDGPSVFRTTEQIVELLQRHSPAEMVKIVQMVGINIPQEVSDGS